ncbi:MAG: glycosyltransferase family 92 protein [Deltaproteobacteria bacterium]|jgi:hypothetical protein|nr:glycosyltransferase family 92 protein [Deltaproteobacteria bacterium]
MKYYLALCCTVKNELPFIEEWLCYHSLIGVEHFFIYDNMSEPPLETLPLLKKFAAQGRITLTRTEGRGLQIPSYEHCLRLYGPLCRWLGFIDLDEFILTRDYADLRAFLAEFEPYAGLALNWALFGSNGHLSRPPGLVINNYTERLFFPAHNLHIKSIVDPARTAGIKNPHTFLYRRGCFCVTERHLPVPAEESFALSLYERAWINHYFFRSQRDFSEKTGRGRASSERGYDEEDYAAFYLQDKYRRREERHIRRFARTVEEWLRRRELPRYLPEPEAENGAQGYVDLARDLILRNEPEKAEVALCRAMPRFAEEPLIWLTRAFIARKKREYPRAEQFIHKALSLSELPQAYLELVHLRLEQGRLEEAGDLVFYLRHTTSFRVPEEGFQAELERLEQKAL